MCKSVSQLANQSAIAAGHKVFRLVSNCQIAGGRIKFINLYIIMFLGIKKQLALLLLAVSLLIGSSHAQQIPAQCNGRVSARQEWRDLTQQQKDTFLSALQCMYNNGQYQRFTEMHRAQNMPWHQGSYFLPAHRAMLHAFEAELRRCNPAVVLPYWDSTLDSQWPSRSPIWNDLGRPVRDQCMTTGPFVNWLSARNSCIIRGFSVGDATNALVSPQVLGETVRNTNNYADFEFAIEFGMHAYVHLVVGGSNGELTFVEISAADPIFYLHHAFVDKVWADWQNFDRANRLNQFNGNHRDVPVSVNAPIPGLSGYTVAGVLDTLNLCFAYANPGVAPPIPPRPTPPVTVTTSISRVTLTPSTVISSPVRSPTAIPIVTPTAIPIIIFSNGTAGNFTQDNSTSTSNSTIPMPTYRVPDPIPAFYCERMMGCDMDRIRQYEKQQETMYVDVYKKQLEGKPVYGPGQTADSYSYKPHIVNGYVTQQDITKLVPYFNRPLPTCRPRPPVPKPPGNSGITSVDGLDSTKTTSFAYKMAEVSGNLILALSVAVIIF